MTPSHDLQQLLEQAAWVQALARRLVTDPAGADDVAQATWLSALEHPPRGLRNPRRWLGKVARNAARQRQRSRSRRSRREEQVAQREALPSVAELTVRAEMQRELAGHVLALQPERREVLLLRFFEGLEPAEIAARLGIPGATVRSRVHRGLQDLRDRLDREHGGRERWLTALTPLAGWEVVPSTTPSLFALGSAVLMSKHLLVSFGLLVCVASTWWLAYRGPESLRPPLETLEVAGAPSLEGEEQTPDEEVQVESTTSASSSRQELQGDTQPTQAAQPQQLHVSVQDLASGSPLEGATIRVVSKTWSTEQQQLATTDEEGLAILSCPRSREAHLFFELEGYATERRDVAELPGSGSYELALHPLGTLEVLALDHEGQPLPKVPFQIQVNLDRGGAGMRDSRTERTDAQGRAVVINLPTGRAMSLWLAGGLDARAVTSIDPLQRRGSVTLTQSALASLRGQVVNADGSPYQGKVKWDGPHRVGGPGVARLDGEGRFELRDLTTGRGRLVIQEAGAPRVEATLAAGVNELDVVRIESTAPVRGRVELPEGEDPSGLRVRLFRAGVPLDHVQAKPDGSFAFETAAGPVELIASRGGWWDEDYYTPPEDLLARALVQAPDEDVVLRPVLSGGEIEGRLRQGQGPVQVDLFATDHLRKAYRPVQKAASYRFATEEGSFVVSGVRPGTYALRLGCTDGTEVWHRDVEVLAQQRTQIGEAGSAALARLDVRLEAATGAATMGAELELIDADNESVAGIVQESGLVSFVDLTPGPWMLTGGIDASERIAPEVLWLEPGQVREHELATQAPVTVTGEVTIGGVPAVGATVKMQHANANEYWSMTTDEKGFFQTATPARPGPYRLWLSDGEMRRIQLVSGREHHERFQVSEPQLQLQLWSDGEPTSSFQHAWALPLSSGQIGRSHPAKVAGSMLLLPALDEPALLLLDLRGPANRRRFASFLPPRPAGSHRHDLGGCRLQLSLPDNQAQGPPVRAFLTRIAGFDDLNERGPFGTPIELHSERPEPGLLVFPHVPQGATVELRGHTAEGGSRQRTIEVADRVSMKLAW